MLASWFVHDDAWEEHSSWFPLCVYVRHIKATTFVNECNDYIQERKQIETRIVNMYQVNKMRCEVF